jgi:hypothetical protein
MIKTTIEENSTIIEPIDRNNYTLPLKIILGRNGEPARYIPVSFERDLIKYDMSLVQTLYPDGTYGNIFIKIEINYSGNLIKDRFEILDL